mgnify:CR=1 FL=1
MSMEKYATYRVFKNKQTGEIKRVLVSEEETMDKIASLTNERVWVELESDPKADVE